jgi:thioredoxin reductase/NAD-dependent dihydropyrimidine dehydrogenase PreA subunit
VTRDVTRVRAVAIAAVGAAAGTAIALAAPGVEVRPRRAVAPPHADIACSACHAEAARSKEGATFAARGACVTCHAADEHASRRPAHRALAARGALACATCHPAHEGAQGLTFHGDGRFVRWTAGASIEARGVGAGLQAGTTVPLAALAVCAQCHDPLRVDDPVARCVPATVRADPAQMASKASLCFDEHARLPTEGNPAGTRFVAWEAAREAAQTTGWVSPLPATGGAWPPALGGALGAALATLGSAALDRRRRRRAPASKTVAAPSDRKRLPTVNTATCLGCYACVDACPFDVLTIERYVAVVARPEECCGVLLCEQVCPNGSLRVDEGEVVADRPRTDEHLESREVPGLFLAGDLTGLPLIKNAILQGVRAVDRIAATLPRRRAAAIDVLVVGAGPAGLSAALRAKDKGLSCVVVEQATVAASIKSFPRAKIVHDPPLELPVEGELWLRESTKEELLAQWTRIVRTRSLDVREGQRVTAVKREGDAFVIAACDEGGRETTLRAARVVVATGRRGTPRRLDAEIDPSALDRVHYSLADARSFEGKRVLVVGLGDSAMEAAVALARQPGVTVTVSYRGDGFRRGKERNVAEVRDLVARGRIRLLLRTVPRAVTQSGVILETEGRGRRTLPADAVFVLIGGIPPWDLLERCGIVRPAAARAAEPA